MEINTRVIKKVIDKNDIYVHFQPIVSVNAKRMMGVEALSRGSFSGITISPYYLFQYAKDLGLTVDLDRLCREKALESFSEVYIAPLLFLNFDADVLEGIDPDTDVILCSTDKYNIPHESIVIEINEKHVKDNNKLIKFVEYYQAKGFMIALDDVGSGHSNLNRISVVKPDIVKIDMALIQGIDKSPLRQEVLKSTINLSKKIGAFTIAEGVETLEEVVTCMLCGIDFFQGFYFSKPKLFTDLYENEIFEKLEEAASSFNLRIKQKHEINNKNKFEYLSAVNGLIKRLSDISPMQYEDVMWEYVTGNDDVECVFLIDINGIQISDTIILEETLSQRRSSLYAPSIKGDSHEIKNYYYAVKEDIENPFISDWYISNATGNSCRTLSSKFIDLSGNTIIVCIDLKFKGCSEKIHNED